MRGARMRTCTCTHTCVHTNTHMRTHTIHGGHHRALLSYDHIYNLGARMHCVPVMYLSSAMTHIFDWVASRQPRSSPVKALCTPRTPSSRTSAEQDAAADQDGGCGRQHSLAAVQSGGRAFEPHKERELSCSNHQLSQLPHHSTDHVDRTRAMSA
jgi:hypothetical protein